MAHIFAVNNEGKGKESLITMLHYKNKGLSVPNAVVFGSDKDISRKTWTRISDVADKTFSSIPAARERFPNYLQKLHA
ncbi:hypothetical protein [Aminiphilus circumscriptus]|uniref:hypothetical protein n=1 Tax=Aminiphilus circumscriptus TaxID=290732 RepID=UPI000492C005|nr:hypothetical protein [Aminiphilus circumscriptus]